MSVKVIPLISNTKKSGDFKTSPSYNYFCSVLEFHIWSRLFFIKMEEEEAWKETNKKET